MTKKEKFVMLVQTYAIAQSESLASAGLRSMRQVAEAMSVSEEDIPEPTDQAAEEYMQYLNKKHRGASVSATKTRRECPEWAK